MASSRPVESSGMKTANAVAPTLVPGRVLSKLVPKATRDRNRTCLSTPTESDTTHTRADCEQQGRRGFWNWHYRRGFWNWLYRS